MVKYIQMIQNIKYTRFNLSNLKKDTNCNYTYNLKFKSKWILNVQYNIHYINYTIHYTFTIFKFKYYKIQTFLIFQTNSLVLCSWWCDTAIQYTVCQSSILMVWYCYTILCVPLIHHGETLLYNIHANQNTFWHSLTLGFVFFTMNFMVQRYLTHIWYL